jgi:hypothetical protein
MRLRWIVRLRSRWFFVILGTGCLYGPVAQWIRALVFGTRCRGFESLRGRQQKSRTWCGFFDSTARSSRRQQRRMAHKSAQVPNTTTPHGSSPVALLRGESVLPAGFGCLGYSTMSLRSNARRPRCLSQEPDSCLGTSTAIRRRAYAPDNQRLRSKWFTPPLERAGGNTTDHQQTTNAYDLLAL